MPKNIKVKLDSKKVNFTPYALSRMSNGLYKATESYKEEDIPILKYFLYCASIELGLKASILSIDNSKTSKDYLRKEIGHDLIKANNLFIEKTSNRTVLNNSDVIKLGKINPFFKNKGLEYITIDVIVELMNGLSNFPDLNKIREIAEKVNKYLLDNKLHIQS